jgi:hypothetical protein
VNNYWQSTTPSGRDSSEPALDMFAALDNLDPQTSEERDAEQSQRVEQVPCFEAGEIRPELEIPRADLPW